MFIVSAGSTQCTHIKWAKPKTNFSYFSFSQKQKAFLPGHGGNREMNKVPNKCGDGKDNWGRWTQPPASSAWQTSQLFRSTLAFIDGHIYMYTYNYLEAKCCVCKHPPSCISSTAKHGQKTERFLRYPLRTVKQGRSLCLVT